MGNWYNYKQNRARKKYFMPKINIYRSFGIRENEHKAFSLLYFQSFCNGFTLSFYVAAVSTLFIKRYGPTELPFAYIITGIIGYIIVTVFSFLQKRITAKKLYLFTLIFIVLLIFVFLSVRLFTLENTIAEDIHIFTMFSLIFPFFALYALVFNGLVIRLFDLQQSKRLFALISTGDIFASIIGFFSVPFLLKIIPNLYVLLVFSISGSVLTLIAFIVIYTAFSDKLSTKAKPKQTVHSGKTKSKRETYIILIFIVAFLSFISVYFADYAFYGSIKLMSNLNVAVFIAIFFGFVKLGEFGMSLISNRLIEQFGMKFGLTILPIIMLTVIVVCFISGFILDMALIIFFMLIAFNKLIDRVIRKAIDTPAFKTLYQPFPDEQKLTIQTSVDGTINQLATGIAGVCLIVYNRFFDDPKTSVQFFTAIFIPIMLIWTIAAFKLFRSYKTKLKQILSNRREKKSTGQVDIYSMDILYRKLKSQDQLTVERFTQFLADQNPLALETFIPSLLDHKNEKITRVILQNINPAFSESLLLRLKKIETQNYTNNTKQLAKQVITFIEESKKKLKSTKTIIELIDSHNPFVKRSGIRFCEQISHPAITSKLIELLKSNEYYKESSLILQKYGNKIISDLEQIFNKEENYTVLFRIIKIFSKIGTPQAIAFLVELLSYSNKQIRQAIIDALYYNNFRANNSQYILVKHKIEQTVNYILWLYACLNDIENERNILKLFSSIDFELIEQYEILFKQLSFICDPSTIGLIKDNYKGERNGFAIEIIENFIDEDIKLIIKPIIEFLQPSVRLKKSDLLFPQQKLSFKARLKDIVNKDYNLVSSIIKIRALELLAKLCKSEIPSEIKACLYHHEDMFRYLSLKLMQKNNTNETERYKTSVKQYFEASDENLLNETGIDELEIVKILKRFKQFIITPENDLLKLAQILKYEKIAKNTSFKMTDKSGESVFFMSKGKLTYIDQFENEISVPRYEFIVQRFSVDDIENVKAKKDSEIFRANKIMFYNLIMEDVKLAKQFFDS
jgi:hypothetical protein